MNKLRIAFVGLGQRGAGYEMTDGSRGLLGNLLDNADVQFSLCDVFPERIEAAKKMVCDAGAQEPFCTNDYKELIARRPDAVIVSTSWDAHARVAMDCMRAGIPVAVEVGGAHSVEECWRLVDCYEETKTPFMFLENCCFNKDEALVTSLVRNKIMGEVVFCQGGYCHDLREEIVGGVFTKHYRLREYMQNNCDNYPTHELGPIAKLLNINSGNRFTKLVSMSSKAAGLNAYIDKTPKYQCLKDAKFAQGDVVTTMIECENGETILLKLDTSLPRLYNRGVTVSGTKGFYSQTTQAVILDDGVFNHESDTYEKAFGSAQNYERFLPSEWRDITPEQKNAGHGGMDYIMLQHFLQCVRDKKPTPIDVYDAASWMCVTALSAQSIAGGCIPVEIPDFTRGAYKTRKTVDVFDYPVVEK